ncbi:MULTISPECIES: MPT63 family protein [Mycobacterium]|uniref:MPT63-like domain-containing protein n=1 Tax=Mycobacterium kiyosense TaxID=2871094 RepID=A0A9P3Q7N3_9MYCO|nr:hypothetical protein IWGMT90018_39970 [Mycobacterium kiyosense]BDE13291.1 hypothetical protein MKCMC460_21510 [Mycobacterium sp. 20KCMC460]GLB83914.1 hypothetical protein SRL2020028_31700 [Mycobacterium kiyosense]GLB90885.1 hypothetical protein SRL2020130_37020 [Mycobacterium kiyosense]GLB96448.1 hypothetical protein SRL2020226_32240 [Mycobacterium kiyosense]
MKFTKTTAKTALGAAGIAAISLFGAASASAAPTIVEGLGTPETLVDGAMSTDYTVSGLQPANVTIPGYTPAGQLWQADVHVKANSGVVTPVVSNFNASAGEQSYRVISAPAAPQGLSPAPIAQGGTATGKIYFDVTGAPPTRVAYNDGAQDVLVWESSAAGNPAPNSIPGQTAPGQTMPGQTAPGQTMPGQTAPGQTMPGQTAPGQTMPGQTTPGQTNAVPGADQEPEVAPNSPVHSS